MSATPTETLAAVCPVCGATPPVLARFCAACGRSLPQAGLMPVSGGLRARWEAPVADAPLGHLLCLGPFVVSLGRGGMLHAFHESSSTPRVSQRLPVGEYETAARLLDGCLVAASTRALVAVDLVPLLTGRRVAVPRDRHHGLPGRPVSQIATDGRGRVAVACRSGGRTEILLFETEPRRGLELRKAFTPSNPVPGEAFWHLWLTPERLMAGQPGGSVRTWALPSCTPAGDIPIPGGLGPLRLPRTDVPVALTSDESLLLLEPDLPEGTRLLYRPDSGTLWSWTLEERELYACLDRTCVRVAVDAAASASADLPGQDYSVLPPVRVAGGAVLLTQDGHLVVVAPEAGSLRIRSAERLPGVSDPVRVAPTCTDRTLFLWIPGSGIRAMEPVP